MNPLTPFDCDLRDFQFMPLDVVRLRDSELATTATGDEAFAAVLLWCASWHQIPAASLPDDDRQLSNFAGYGRGVKEWLRIRPMAMRGWVKCDDGRLYHPVVAEKAREAWAAKLRRQWQTELSRIKKAAQRAGVDPEYPTFDDWLLSRGTNQHCPDNVPGDNTQETSGRAPPKPFQGTGIGTGIGTGTGTVIKKASSLRSQRGDEADPPDDPPPDQPQPCDIEQSGAWLAFEAHHQQTRKWSLARRMLALGQLRAIAASGGNPEAVLTWALGRGLSDLTDCARRMAADAAKESAHENRPRTGQSLADAALEKLQRISANTAAAG